MDLGTKPREPLPNQGKGFKKDEAHLKKQLTTAVADFEKIVYDVNMGVYGDYEGARKMIASSLDSLVTMSKGRPRKEPIA